MALTDQEKQILDFAKQNGKSPIEAKAAIAKYRSQNPQPTAPQPTQDTSTVQSRLAEVGQGNAGKINDAISGQGQYEGQSALTRGIGATATAFNTVPQAVVAIAPEPVRNVVSSVGGAIGGAFKAFTDLIGSNKQLQEFVQNNPEATDKIMGTLQGASDLGAISGNILGAQGTANTLAKGSTLTAQGVGNTIDAIKQVPKATQGLVDNATELIKGDNIVGNALSPKKTPTQAAGEVLQGKPADVAKGIEALKAIDTTGVKTYAELGNKVDDSIRTLSRVVDDELAKDTTKTKLADLNTNLKTKTGNVVTTNYVKTSLEHLKELYTKTGEVDKAANIDDLINAANTDGLSKVEINDIARVYNSEFGSKAFSPATGDALTSVNAQLYENIRKGVKDKAREGIGGAEAKAADQTVSALYNTKKLVQKNTEAVNKLQQKIAERGVFEKAGYFLSKYADIATGGTIRGLVGGLLPRGAGYKTMNALDLEQRLQGNLEIINRASKAKTDAEMVKILSELEQ